MLGRYKMYRGKRPSDDPLPQGIRQDTRWRTKHPLRPSEALVKEYLAAPDDGAWERYVPAYFRLLEERFREDRAPFDKLAGLAMTTDVSLGCNCPTVQNPAPGHCHTFLAVEFMKRKYPNLPIIPTADSALQGM